MFSLKIMSMTVIDFLEKISFNHKMKEISHFGVFKSNLDQPPSASICPHICLGNNKTWNSANWANWLMWYYYNTCTVNCTCV